MDDRWREFGEFPGYEFDGPRGPGQPRPGIGDAQWRDQGWPQQPPREWAPTPPSWEQAGPQQPSWERAWPPPPSWERARPQRPPSRPPLTPAEAYQAAEADQAPRPGRPGVLARETLAAMRARNWLTSLAAPLVAAIAVGVAAVVVLGANNGRGADAPSALAAGFPPARLAAADFAGGGGPVEVSAIAAGGATEVAVGSASRGCALWASVDGGSSWRRAALPTAAAGQANAGQLAGVAHGPSGWLAVGGAAAAAGPAAALRPAVIGSPDGLTWTVTGTGAAFDGPGRIVTTGVSAGPGGYVIVGTESTGPRTVAAAWYAPGLTGWRRAASADAQPGALDGPGNRAMNAVSAVGRGFVAVGAAGDRPAAWLSATGRTWTLVPLPLPAGAASAALDYVAANGGVVAAVGTEVTAAGQRLPFAAVSTDAGGQWSSAPLPLPAGGAAGAASAAATALTAAGGGFTATGTYGSPGQTDVVVWTLPAGSAAGTAGTAWTEVAPPGTGLAGPGVQAITALTATGATLTGIGFTAASATTATEPTIWQSPARS
jgi:hypothetical protein